MSLLTYYLEVNIGLAVISVGYLVLLNGQNLFSYNRGFILAGIAASLLFPLITIKSNAMFLTSIGESLSNYQLPELVIDANETIETNFFNYTFLIAVSYSIVTAGLLLNLIIKIYRLLHLKKGNFEEFENYTIVENSEGYESFSFFHFVFIGKSYSPEDKQQILTHELAHVRNFHSMDILLIELLKVFFWFNPIVYVIKKIIISIHEFQADQSVVEKCDAKEYCTLLARVALQSADFPIANHFNNSLTFKRINMIKNVKERLHWWRITSSLAIILGLFIFVSCKEEAKQNEEISSSNEVYATVDESAAPSNGFEDFYGFIGSNLKYPAQARQQGVEGKVFVVFVVNKDGSISDVSVVKGIGAGCDQAAIDVISSSPKWKPGKLGGLIVRQKFTVPIQFKLG